MMDGNTVISVKDVKKSFKVFHDRSFELKERLLFRKRNAYDRHLVLNGISFDIRKGESVGIIGVNGCGKSTLLKMLSRIMYPDEGNIRINGKVSALIELGAGFHPDMTGRENIYINASIFGFSKKEIGQAMESIIAFADLGEYIDAPVRTYSSGMYMRLAFSVAINVKADILLIDEILAVGDAGFQGKCFRKLKEIRESGTTIVVVSHAMESLKENCTRCIWVSEGKIEADGEPSEVIGRYLKSLSGEENHG